MNINTCSISKATPSEPKPYLHLPVLPVISESTLNNLSIDDSAVGSGRFGYCTKMTYKDMFIVCVKRMEKEIISLQALKSEAAILYSLNGAGFTPHCFGICTDHHAIIMSYIHVDMKSISLYTLLYESHTNITLSSQVCTQLLVNLCKGVQFIHSLRFLHNDLKLDNVVIGSTMSGTLKPYVIDFGKACPRKKYALSEAEKDIDKREHPQIAPDLRDGLVVQSEMTDVYSFGRIMKRCNSVIIHSTKLVEFIRRILAYHSQERPDLETILSILHG